MASISKGITVYGRLSFPVWSFKDAVERNKKSDYPKTDESTITPEFHLLLDQAQLDKFKTYVTDVFFPDLLARKAAGETKNALDQAQVDRLLKVVNSDWTEQPPYIPIKPLSEKSAELAPEAVASLKVNGMRGQDLVLKAVVNSEDELVIPDENILAYPIIQPINRTVHELYPGSLAAATLNLYSFVSGKLPGFSASTGTVIFKADAERFGGGIAVDEDEIFAD